MCTAIGCANYKKPPLEYILERAPDLEPGTIDVDVS
jgi:hypothetical protein